MKFILASVVCLFTAQAVNINRELATHSAAAINSGDPYTSLEEFDNHLEVENAKYQQA